MAKTIALKGDFIRKEVEATATITPGMQVTHAGAAGGKQRRAFALENDLIGRGIDDNYVSGELMQVGVFPPGAEVYALLEAGANVAVGAALQGNGLGMLEAAASGSDYDTIAYALEAVNNTGTLPVRIRVEIM